MRKLFFIVFLFVCSQIVAQSPIPTYVVGDTTILAAYTGTNTLAAVKDTGVTGGMYLYDATGTYVPDGSTNFVTSVKGGIWLHITSLNSGSSVGQRFGIEDNLGIEDRSIEMQHFGLNIADANSFYVDINNGKGGIAMDGYGDNGGFGVYHLIDSVIGSYDAVNINKLGQYFEQVRDTGTGQILRQIIVPDMHTQLSPNTSPERFYFPLSVSVNGGSPNYADSTGNIDITSEQLPWHNLFSASFTAAGGVAGSTTSYGQVTGRASGWLTESGTQFVMSEAFTMERLFITTSNGQPGSPVSDDLVITLRVNGGNTALTVTIPGGSSAGTFSDVTHTVSISAGDLIDWQVANASSSTSATIISIGATGIGQ